MTIWKYPLPVDDCFFVTMPVGARLLSVQMQDGQPCLWALVDPTAAKIGRLLRVYGTGSPISGDPGAFVGTFQMHGGALVFHLFDGAP
jgi:hypothetical protein